MKDLTTIILILILFFLYAASAIRVEQLTDELRIEKSVTYCYEQMAERKHLRKHGRKK